MQLAGGAVMVRGFDFGTSDEQIEAHMGQAGTVTKIEKIDDGSACVMYSTLEEAQAAVASLQQTIIQGNSRYVDVLPMDPEEFVAGYTIEQDKLNQFFSMTPEQQRFVIGKGSLSTARDPTAVLVGRMTQARAMTGGGGPSVGVGSVHVRGFDYGTTDEQISAHMGQVGTVLNIQYIDDGSRCVTYGSSEEAQAAVANLQQSVIPGTSRYIDVLLTDPQAFLAEHNIQPDKHAQFLGLTPQQQYAVIAKGELASARDPTAVLVQRMNQVRNAGKGGFGPMTGKGGAGLKGALGALMSKGPYSGGGKGGKGDKGAGKLGMLLKLAQMMGGGGKW